MNEGKTPIDLRWPHPSSRRVLVTGASTGVGFEAAAQLANYGLGSVTITSRTQSRAEDVVEKLRQRTGRDVFSAISVNLSDIASSRAAADALVSQGEMFDGVILNAGAAPTSLVHTADGLDVCFASNLIGHHIVVDSLVKAQLLGNASRVIMASSELATGRVGRYKVRLPTLITHPPADPALFADYFVRFARSDRRTYRGYEQLAGVKAIATWWVGAMQRQSQGPRYYAVSPGTSLGKFVEQRSSVAGRQLVSLIASVGGYVGRNTSGSWGSRRYLEVLLGSGKWPPGRLYASPPSRANGPLTLREVPFLEDSHAQENALSAIAALADGKTH